MQFPINNLFDEEKCYAWLLEFFHDGQLGCPRCGSVDYRPHTYSRQPVIQYRCYGCDTYFNLFSATAFKGTKWPCSTVVSVLRGFLKGESTKGIAEEHGLARPNLHNLRHRLMENAYLNREAALLPDQQTESDEVFQNAGEKGLPHTDPGDPPRCRANKKKDRAHSMATAPPSMAPSAGKAEKSG